MNDNERTQKTWTMELTEDEMIALAKVLCDWTEVKTASGHITLEELQAMQLMKEIDHKFPDVEWFSEEVRA